MRVCKNRVMRDATSAELAAFEAVRVAEESPYWQSIPYDEAVNTEIRKRYTVSQEFAILRQRDEKPEEYAAYYAYCEQCKAYVKGKKAEVVADGP